MNLTTALNIDLYDPNEDKRTLKDRLKTLAKLLEKQKPPFSNDILLPTITHLLDTDIFIHSEILEWQISLTCIFIHSFRLTMPSLPIIDDEEHISKLGQIFHLVCQAYIKSPQNTTLLSLLDIIDSTDLFILIKDDPILTEVFTTFILFSKSSAIHSLSTLLNSCGLLPISLVQKICEILNPKLKFRPIDSEYIEPKSDNEDNIESITNESTSKRGKQKKNQNSYQKDSQKNLSSVLDQLSSSQLSNLIGYIHHSAVTEGTDTLITYSSLVKLLSKSKLEENLFTLFSCFDSGFIDMNESIRKKSFRLGMAILRDISFTSSTSPLFQLLIRRSSDACRDIRADWVDFAIDFLHNKLFEIRAEYPSEWTESCERLSNLIVDCDTEIRRSVMSELLSYEVSSVLPLINHNVEKIADRLLDPDFEVRLNALQLFLEILEEEACISPEYIIRIILNTFRTAARSNSLYMFSHLIGCDPQPHSKVYITLEDAFSYAETNGDLEIFSEILSTIKDLRQLVPRYLSDNSDSEASQRICALLGLFTNKTPNESEWKNASRNLLEDFPQFIIDALSYSKRIELEERLEKGRGRKISGRDKDSVILIMASYQPTPFLASDVIESSNFLYTDLISKIFPEEFESYIEQLSAELNKTNLNILSHMNNIDIPGDIRKRIVSNLYSFLTSSKKKKLIYDIAMKAFTTFAKEGDEELIAMEETMKDKDLKTRLQFCASIGSAPRWLFKKKTIHEIKKLGLEAVNSATKLATSELIKHPEKPKLAKRVIKLLRKLCSKYPLAAFESYINISHLCREQNTPEIFLLFSSIVQNSDADVRLGAIRALQKALGLPQTPTQFLSFLALSATDPDAQNVTESEKILRALIQQRREIIDKIEKAKQKPPPSLKPESSLPYLIYILAHHPDYELDDENKPTFCCYLEFFLKQLLANSKVFQSTINLLSMMMFAEDISGNQEYTDRIAELSQMAVGIVKRIGGNREWKDLNSDEPISLPAKFFRQASEKNTAKITETVMKVDTPLLSPKSPGRRGILKNGMSPAPIKKVLKTSLVKAGKMEISQTPNPKARKAKELEEMIISRSSRRASKSASASPMLKDIRKRKNSPSKNVISPKSNK